MTMPIAFAESFSTKTDEFSAVWALSFVYYLLYIVKLDTKNKRYQSYYLHYIFMGISAGLAFEDKPNVMISIVWFALFLLLFCIHRCMRGIVTFRKSKNYERTSYWYDNPRIFRISNDGNNEYGDYVYTNVNVTNEKKFGDSDIIVYISEDSPDTDL